jgi:hypothetical protein
MVRLGSIQKISNGAVGKIMKKVLRTDPETGEEEELCIFKLHYNGSFLLAPTHLFETPTKEEKREDKRNAPYWRNEHQSLTGKISYTGVPVQWFNL